MVGHQGQQLHILEARHLPAASHQRKPWAPRLQRSPEVLRARRARPHSVAAAQVNVNGPQTHPVWKFLKETAGGGDVKWNFGRSSPSLAAAAPALAGAAQRRSEPFPRAEGATAGAKFIIDKDGRVVGRNGDSPSASEPTLKTLLVRLMPTLTGDPAPRRCA